MVIRGGDYGWPEVHGFRDRDMPGEEQVCRAVYIATSNRDGRGSPDREDDRILVLRPEK